MAWTNLPTDYTDATFVGHRKYTEVDNGDGTVSFLDATAYTNKEKSFFGANDANKMNDAINGIMAKIDGVPSYKLAQVTLAAAAWESRGDYYTQPVTIAGIEANERVDVQPDAEIMTQLMNDSVSTLYIENESGTLTAYSLGNAPSVSLTVQVTLVGLPFLDLA